MGARKKQKYLSIFINDRGRSVSIKCLTFCAAVILVVKGYNTERGDKAGAGISALSCYIYDFFRVCLSGKCSDLIASYCKRAGYTLKGLFTNFSKIQSKDSVESPDI